MSKELTPLQAWKEIKDFVVDGHSLALETEEKGFPLIETVLKNEDLEKSKLLQQVRELKDDVACLENLNSKLQYENEDYKKAVEIIKTLVSKSGIEIRFNGHKEITIIWYQKEGEYEDECYYLYKCESREEYELLKEVFKDEKINYKIH